MYRTANTPTGAAGRRSTRSARGSAKRRHDGSNRGGGGDLKRKFEKAAERPARKWVKISRPPASNITFRVRTWVPYADLTEEERINYETEREKEAERRRQKESSELQEVEKDERHGEREQATPKEVDNAMSDNLEESTPSVENFISGAEQPGVEMPDAGEGKKRSIGANEPHGEGAPSTKRIRLGGLDYEELETKETVTQLPVGQIALKPEDSSV